MLLSLRLLCAELVTREIDRLSILVHGPRERRDEGDGSEALADGFSIIVYGICPVLRISDVYVDEVDRHQPPNDGG